MEKNREEDSSSGDNRGDVPRILDTSAEYMVCVSWASDLVCGRDDREGVGRRGVRTRWDWVRWC